jgi:hypothetical protein
MQKEKKRVFETSAALAQNPQQNSTSLQTHNNQGSAS